MPRLRPRSIVGALLFAVTILILGIIALPALRHAAPPSPTTTPPATATRQPATPTSPPATPTVVLSATPIPTPTARRDLATPTAPPASDLFFERPWPLDGQIAWLTAQRCISPPTPGPNDVVPAEMSPNCQGVIFATVDGGATWTRQYQGDVLVQSIAFVDHSHGWAIGASHPQCRDVGCPSAILRTEDGGAHWSIAFDAPYFVDQSAFVSPTDGWLVGIDCADRPTGENACAVKLLTTTDGGTTWQPSSLAAYAAPSSLTMALARPTRNDGWLALSSPTTSQLLVTHDGAHTWQTLKSPAPTGWPDSFNLDFLDPHRGWLLAGGQSSAGNQEKFFFTTNDGGATWRQVGASTASKIPSISVNGQGMTVGYVAADGLQFLSLSTGWLSLGRFGLLRTTDAGLNWTPVAIPNQADGFVAFRFASPRVAWALTPRSLAKTLDGGATWQVVALPGT